MKVTTKKGLCVLNTILTAVAFLFIHATIWLGRGHTSQDLQWLYLDGDIVVGIIPGCFATGFAFRSCFANPQEKDTKGLYMASAVFCAIPAIIFTVLLAVFGYEKKDVVVGWRLFPAIAIYYAVAILYFVIAFVKTKQVDKIDEPIPYND